MHPQCARSGAIHAAPRACVDLDEVLAARLHVVPVHADELGVMGFPAWRLLAAEVGTAARCKDEQARVVEMKSRPFNSSSIRYTFGQEILSRSMLNNRGLN
jgi:hypothetical protein